MITYIQMLTRLSKSVQLHSYMSLQLVWLWFIRVPSFWGASESVSSQIRLKDRTLPASEKTCVALWKSLKDCTVIQHTCTYMYYIGTCTQKTGQNTEKSSRGVPTYTQIFSEGFLWTGLESLASHKYKNWFLKPFVKWIPESVLKMKYNVLSKKNIALHLFTMNSYFHPNNCFKTEI